ncbi:MAG: nodulation protein NfeD [Elusimicrobiales bacterium]|nr:nodulation protein NfeD [Elusimicrobiales bacterium]
MTIKTIFLTALALAFAQPAAAAKTDRPAAPVKTCEVRKVVVAPYSGVITPAAAEFISGAVEKVNAPGGADLLVVALDTPGGLDSSMRTIIKAMLASKKPVAVYVSPQGARAASAGVFISMASPLVAMAPGTNIGAAHPVMIGGGSPLGGLGGKDGKKPEKEPMEEKVLNDASAYMKSITQKTGRNVDWAIKSVTKSESISAEEAVKGGVADFIAADLTEFLAKADGFKAGDFGVLRTGGAEVEYFRQTSRQKFLATITDPNIAMILMSLGAAGMFIELYNPGLILPGVVGAVSLVLAFYSFQTLSANFAGVALILLGFVFFIAEIKVISYGLLTLGGAVAIMLGALMLFNTPSIGGLSVSMHMILTTIIGLVAVVAGLAWFVARAQLRKVVTGIESLKDKRGLAKTALSPRGTVLVEGELWEAESVSGDIPAGAEVDVTAVEGFRVRVRQAK